MAKKFKVKTRDNFTDKILYIICRIFKRTPKFFNLNDGAPDGRDLPKSCLMIGNHNGAGGPFTYRMFLKKRFMSWGAHPMCEGFSSRRHYLYHTFYRQKLGWNRFKAFVMSYIFGVISKWAYAFAGIIPTYPDSRLFHTYKYSMECFEKDVSVLVFPEDSEYGYKEYIERFWPGFIHFAKLYYKRTGVDFPIYTMYYCKKPKSIVIGKPLYYQELAKEHTDEEILEIFRRYMNSLGDVIPKKTSQKKKGKNAPESPDAKKENAA